MPRLFAAIELPAGHSQALLEQHRGIDAARWEREPHITLAHFGTVADDQAADLGIALAAVHFTPFGLTPGGIGFFDRHVMWVGVEPSADLIALAEKLASIRSRFVDEVERHGFNPHITLAHLRVPDEKQLTNYVSGFDHSALTSFAVGSFTLFESDSGRYHQVAQYRAH